MEENVSFEKLINSGLRLAVLETGDPDRIVALFKRLTLTTGQAVYDWSPDNGLYRLGIETIFIPRTRTPVDALAYVSSARHYGIYLMRGFENAVVKPSVQKMMQAIVDKDDGVRRLVIMLGQDIDVGPNLKKHCARIRHNVKSAQKTGTNG